MEKLEVPLQKRHGKSVIYLILFILVLIWCLGLVSSLLHQFSWGYLGLLLLLLLAEFSFFADIRSYFTYSNSRFVVSLTAIPHFSIVRMGQERNLMLLIALILPKCSVSM